MELNSTSSVVCFHIGEVSYNFTNTVVIAAWISVVLNTFGMVFAFIGNSLVIYVMIIKTELHSASNTLLTALGTTDIAVAVFVQPLSIVLRINESRNIQLCNLKTVYGALSFISGITSIVTVTLISFDRCMAILYPIRYKSFTFITRVYIAVVCLLWILSIMIVTLTYTNQIEANSFYKSVIGIFVVTSTVILVCYIKINRESVDRKRRIQQISCVSTEITQRQDANRHKTITLILAVYYLCYAPKLIHKMILYFGVQDSNFIYAARITETFVHLNSACNPCIYTYRNKAIREAVKITISNILGQLRKTFTINLPTFKRRNALVPKTVDETCVQSSANKTEILKQSKPGISHMREKPDNSIKRG